MTHPKKYNKPKFSIIKISTESLLDFADVVSGENGETDEADIKIQTFQIFDDSFDDLEEESDYTTTTNTIEVW